MFCKFQIVGIVVSGLIILRMRRDGTGKKRGR